MSFFNNLFETGIYPDQPEYLRKKVRLSNQIALIFIVLIQVYILFTYLYFPLLLPFPILCLVIGLITFWLNRSRLNLLSRFLLSIGIVLSLSLYHSYLIMRDEPLITSLYTLQLSLMIVTILLFDFRELTHLSVTAAVMVILFLIIPLLNPWLEVQLDNSIFRTGIIATISNLVACIIMLSGALFLLHNNYSFELKNDGLLSDIKKTNDSLFASQLDLNESLEQLKKSQEVDRRRNWIADGISQLYTLVRKRDTAFEDVVTSFLVKYVNANQASLFIRDGHSDYIDLRSCYAFSKRRVFSKRVGFGEGLAGQVFYEKEKVLVTKLPDDFITIGSGLGEANPTCVLILPLIHNDFVIGVFELASFSVFEDYQIEFLEKSCEVLANELTIRRVNEETQQLLEKSKKAEEALRQQETEMRQNLEEMSAIQEEMKRREMEYQQKLGDLQAVC